MIDVSRPQLNAANNACEAELRVGDDIGQAGRATRNLGIVEEPIQNRSRMPVRMLTLIILSCSVAADATAVAIAASVRGITWSRGIAMACLFGGAQALMAGIGWIGGTMLGGIWSDWDHWIALVLLSAVGARMIKEAFSSDDDRKPGAGGPWTLVVLAVATSIDALAVGVSLPALKLNAAIALTSIGVVTLLFSAAGAAFGRFLGERFGRAIEVAGGIGLIAIGVQIVVEHAGR